MTIRQFKAKVTDIHDGDTFKCSVDLGASYEGRGAKPPWDYGFHLYGEHGRLIFHADVRLNGCNARELEAPGGAEARNALEALMPLGSTILLTSYAADKYAGRYDCDVELEDGTNLVEALAAEQWVALWNGKGTKPVPPWPRTIAQTTKRRKR